MKPEKHGINMGLKNMSDLREFESSRETDRERDRQTDRQTDRNEISSKSQNSTPDKFSVLMRKC